MAPTWLNEPCEFRLCGVQLKTVRAHPAGNMFDAADEVTAERRQVVWVTQTVNLYVVGVHVDSVGSVRHEQERAQYGPLWHAKLDDDDGSCPSSWRRVRCSHQGRDRATLSRLDDTDCKLVCRRHTGAPMLTTSAVHITIRAGQYDGFTINTPKKSFWKVPFYTNTEIE